MLKVWVDGEDQRGNAEQRVAPSAAELSRAVVSPVNGVPYGLPYVLKARRRKPSLPLGLCRLSQTARERTFALLRIASAITNQTSARNCVKAPIARCSQH